MVLAEINNGRPAANPTSPLKDTNTIPWAPAPTGQVQKVALRSSRPLPFVPHSQRHSNPDAFRSLSLCPPVVDVREKDDSGRRPGGELVQELRSTVEQQQRRIVELEAGRGEMERVRGIALRVPGLEDHLTKLRAERDYLHSAYTSSANSVVDMQTELEVLNAGLEDRNAQVHEAQAARDFAEQESRSARTCLRELEGDKAVQDLRISSLSSEVLTLSAEKTKLEGRLAATKLELVDALDRERRQLEETGALLAALERLEASEALRATQGGCESETDLLAPPDRSLRFDQIAEDEESDTAAARGHAHSDDEVEILAQNSTLDEYDVVDLQRELATPSEVAPPVPFNLKAKFQALVSTSRGRSHSVSRSQPSSQAVKLFAVKELEDDLADLRILLAQLCEDFTATDSSKLKRLQRLQTQMDEIMDTMRVTATKLKAVRSFVR